MEKLEFNLCLLYVMISKVSLPWLFLLNLQHAILYLPVLILQLAYMLQEMIMKPY